MPYLRDDPNLPRRNPFAGVEVVEPTVAAPPPQPRASTLAEQMRAYMETQARKAAAHAYPKMGAL